MSDIDLINEMDSQAAWSRARRNIIVQRVLCAIQECSMDLIPFEEARQRLHLNQKICRGIQQVKLDHIRGSVGRYQDFTSAFLPRRNNLRQRWQRVWSAMSQQWLPPVELYKVGEAYFVSDGNHRISVARKEGLKTIEAYVCEYITDLELSGEADLNEVLCREEYAVFLRNTQLQPEEVIRFTTPGRYMELECQIRSVQESLESKHRKPVPFEQAAAQWYREIYLPTIDEIRNTGVVVRFPRRTEADLFIWMWQREPELQSYCSQTANSGSEDHQSNALKRSISKLIAAVSRIFD